MSKFSCENTSFFTCARHVPNGVGSGIARDPRSGRSLKIDIHCHCNTPAANKLVERLTPPVYRTQPNELTRSINRENARREMPKHADVNLRLADMDRMGIDVQAISTGPMQYFYWTEPEVGRATSRLINDNLADIVAKHPDRFVALGTLPMQDSEMALAELERCMGELGMRGVELCTNVNGEELAAPRFEKLFARLEELGAVVFLHPFSYNESERFNDYNFTNLIGHPLDSAIAVGHLIFGGTLERYPGLKIVIAHGGGYAPFYPGRFDHAFHARADGREHISAPPSTYLSKLYFDTMVYNPRQVETLVRMWGSDHVVVGTDYPFDMGDKDPLGFVDTVKGLTEKDVEAITGGNAARLLKLDEAWIARAMARTGRMEDSPASA